jgi:hypothetical protein
MDTLANRGKLSEALKGASGPREGQKSTFCSTQFDLRTDFCPQYADLGIGEEVRHAGTTTTTQSKS